MKRLQYLEQNIMTFYIQMHELILSPFWEKCKLEIPIWTIFSSFYHKSNFEGKCFFHH